MECKDCKYYKKPTAGRGYGSCKAKNLAECPGYQETLRWGFKPRQQEPNEDHPMGCICAEWIGHRGDWRLYQIEHPQQTVAYVDDLEDPRSRGYEVIVTHEKEEQQ